MKVVFAGNPNVGKTSLFNRITGSFEHVGNYPGVTVKRKAKTTKIDGEEYEFVDLPGLYSLLPKKSLRQMNCAAKTPTW